MRPLILKQYDPNIPRISIDDYENTRPYLSDAINTLTIGMNLSTAPRYRFGNATFNATIGYNPTTALTVAYPVLTATSLMGSYLGGKTAEYFGINPVVGQVAGGFIPFGVPKSISTFRKVGNPRGRLISRAEVDNARELVLNWYDSKEAYDHYINSGATPALAKRILQFKKLNAANAHIELKPIEADGETLTIVLNGQTPISTVRINPEQTNPVIDVVAHELSHAATHNLSSSSLGLRTLREILSHNRRIYPILKPEMEGDSLSAYMQLEPEMMARGSASLITKGGSNLSELEKYFTKDSVNDFLNKVWTPIALTLLPVKEDDVPSDNSM